VIMDKHKFQFICVMLGGTFGGLISGIILLMINTQNFIIKSCIIGATIPSFIFMAFILANIIYNKLNSR